MLVAVPIIYFCIQYLVWIILFKCCRTPAESPSNNRDIQLRLRAQRSLDRQNNVELGRQHSRFGDIFFIEPNSQEAARIREQLEKDDKELPSYDEVMRMCNLTTPTAAAALPTPTMASSAIGIAALPAPPYSECDPHLSVETTIAATNAVTASSLEPSPSTSRAAQIPT
ncbi:uncharacterized protein LOC135431778 isoform X3 [Drosophila montana]|uniref:uncharacterized protein LOC135431778 isoform X3 n=1 Tax=Drosophila montana TaxID=40370 RepID=UPI00313EE080